MNCFPNILCALANCIFLCNVLLGTVQAEIPPAPPFTNGSGDPAMNGMKHAGVAFTGTGIEVHLAESPPSPVVMTPSGGRDFTPDKFDVLEQGYFNGQHGWLPEGVFNGLPQGASIWIQRTGASQPPGAAFHVYEGGNMTQGMDTWTMQEVYADGTPWQWDGLMQHDYFVVDRPGQYSMSFDVYVGDSQGIPWSGLSAGSTTLSFVAVPEPTALFSVLLGGLMLRGRRRR
ncbi:MAG: PEP-CTERM sorting domain-containing protein [Planctomycetales bacterium]|nr:PEP-CTERM sorting domain-containing protein [Planctomycetales bacterium]